MSRKKKSKSKELAAASPAPDDTRPPLWVIIVLVLITLLIYSNSFSGSFIYDDDQAINKNHSIEHLWPLLGPAPPPGNISIGGGPLRPPGDLTVGGRPLLNLSFALNYAINGRTETWSYHVFNFTIHVLAGLALLGVLRRTFLQPKLRARFGADALLLAGTIALLWLVNPLQTESVSYISQRAEALFGLCYLFTLYCFIRSTDGQAGVLTDRDTKLTLFDILLKPRLWNSLTWTILAIVCCSAGSAFKEIMVSAPFMVLLYDRTFVAGSFWQALSRRWALYLGLALTWLVIWVGTFDIQGRVVGYHYGIGAWDYALTETRVLCYYLYLMVWPHPLIIDYGTHIYRMFATQASWDLNYDDIVDCLPAGLLVVSLLVATVVALVRWPLIGFVAAWFFLILAPTSSFFPIVVSPIGEHRLYLPLLTFLVPFILFLHWFCKWLARYISIGEEGEGGFWFCVIVLAVVWGSLSYLRNEDYSTDVSLWAVTVGEEPDNARAHNNYGVTLLGQSGRTPEPAEANRLAGEAAQQFQMAVTIQPSYPDAHYNWGNATAQLRRYQEAIEHYKVALAQKPTMGSAENNWGNALDAMGPQHEPEAIDHYLRAIQLDPNDAQFHYNLGHGYLVLKRFPEALEQFKEALRLNPGLADTHNTLGIVYFQMGDRVDAINEFEEALRLNPNLQPARDNLNKVGGPGLTP